MRHVSPHRWADVARGTVPVAERARMAEHAESCDRCARARDRITGARDAFSEIARGPAPELRWETIGAKIYWATSQERRARSSSSIPALRPAPIVRKARWLLLPALAVTAAAGVATWFEVVGSPDGSLTAMPAPAPPADLPEASDLVPIALVDMPAPLTGLVTLIQGDASIGAVRGADLFNVPVIAGQVITTGADGRIAVQIAEGTAFAAGPGTTLALPRLDDAAIELAVDGEVSVEVTRRAADQRFIVIAGERTVEVRGTAFEVLHEDGRVEVRCRHGVVAVSEPGIAEVVEVPAGRRWVADDHQSLLAHPPAPISEALAAQLAERAPAQLPAWSDAASLLRTTGPVAVAAPAGRAIRIDGVRVGRGELTVRVMSGRHLVETERAPDRWRDGEWIATRDDGRIARIEMTRDAAAKPTEDRAARRAAVQARRAELDEGVDRARMSGCLRGLAKQGLSQGTHIVLEIGVDATGAVSFLNVGDTDLPSSTAGCVRDVVAEAQFPAGPKASWRHRFSF